MSVMNEVEYSQYKKMLEKKCIPFAVYGSTILKKHFEENNMDYKIQVKRQLINKDDPAYSPYHYYIEIKTDRGGKMILDNEDLYNYYYYKNRYTPQMIRKVGVREMKYDLKHNIHKGLEEAIEKMIIYRVDCMKKWDMLKSN